ncbi:hypothetical protein Glove_707g33 [Diversispora epigaea]|uniref:Uncharacterized protein n=1 Tax=Diversispora epigaea TaxID=1348612 RepID=A0A397GA17_9GLOM|nr:hypothetical protein Glove_707g33 [Diversispora epigaea]
MILASNFRSYGQNETLISSIRNIIKWLGIGSYFCDPIRKRKKPVPSFEEVKPLLDQQKKLLEGIGHILKPEVNKGQKI